MNNMRKRTNGGGGHSGGHGGGHGGGHRSNNNRSRNGGGGGGKFRGPSIDSQSLARQKKHALMQKEKYLAMARDAGSNGDRVEAEYYYQHVEHYSRVVGEIIEQEPRPQAGQAYDNNAAEQDGSESSTEGEDSAQDASAEHQPQPSRHQRTPHRPRHIQSSPPVQHQQTDDEIPLPNTLFAADPDTAANA